MSRYLRGLSRTFVGEGEEVDYGYGIDPTWPRLYRHILIFSRKTADLPSATSLGAVKARLVNRWLKEYGIGPQEGMTSFGYLSSMLHVFFDAIPEEMWELISSTENQKIHDGVDIPPPAWVLSSINLRRQVGSLDQADPEERAPSDVVKVSMDILHSFSKDFDDSRVVEHSAWENFALKIGRYGEWLVRGAKETIEAASDLVTKPAREIFDILKTVLLVGGIMIGGVFAITLAGNRRTSSPSPPALPSPRPRTKGESQRERVLVAMERKEK